MLFVRSLAALLSVRSVALILNQKLLRSFNFKNYFPPFFSKLLLPHYPFFQLLNLLHYPSEPIYKLPLYAAITLFSFQRTNCPICFFFIVEISLLSKEARRIATVRARTQCDLFSLSCDDFNNTLKDYPQMKEVLRRVAEARLHNIGASDSVGNIDPQFW